MLSLSQPIISVEKDGVFTYGGSQRLSENKIMAASGCGVIAAADLLLYLALTRPECATPYTGIVRSNIISHERYERLCSRLRSSFLPVIPNFGKTGPAMALGLNSLFSRYRLPFRACWCVSHEKLWQRMEEMLSTDIPVIFSVGQNFPAFWGSHKLRLYRRGGDGFLHPAAKTKAHYVTVTGMDESWLRISSWGREYYIRRSEYTDYVRRHSSPVTSNLLYIQHK